MLISQFVGKQLTSVDSCGCIVDGHSMSTQENIIFLLNYLNKCEVVIIGFQAGKIYIKRWKFHGKIPVSIVQEKYQDQRSFSRVPVRRKKCLPRNRYVSTTRFLIKNLQISISDSSAGVVSFACNYHHLAIGIRKCTKKKKKKYYN